MKQRLLGRLDRYQQTHTWLGFPLAVLKKFSEDQASNLAALIAYYAFFSIFPLLLAATTVLGFVLQGDPGLRNTIEGSWLGSFPIIGQSIGKHAHLSGSVAGLVVGLALALWSGLAVARTAQGAFNTVYAVAKVDRPNVVQKTWRGFVLMVTIGGGLVVSTLVNGLVTGSGTFGLDLGVGGKVGGYLLTIAVDVGVFVLAFQWLTVRDLTWRDVLPGATFAAVSWFVLQTFATFIVNHKIAGSSSTYGDFATVIALLTWFYLAAQFVLLGAEIDTVLLGRLWPRALVDAPQTEADERAFEAYAERERYVRHEDVDTEFGADTEPEDPLGIAGRRGRS